MSITNNFGLEFLDFIKMKETELDNFQNLAGSFSIIECEGKYLLCYNIRRKQWELPAGKQEEGETPKECAIRELYEESGQEVNVLEFKGLMKVKKHKDNTIKYNPVYFSYVNELQPFKENNETSQIKLWDRVEDLGEIDVVDIKLLDFV